MFLTYNGPAKSTPTCENARSSDTLDCGRGGVGSGWRGCTTWLSSKFSTLHTLQQQLFHFLSSLDNPVVGTYLCRCLSYPIVFNSFMTVQDSKLCKMMFPWQQQRKIGIIDSLHVASNFLKPSLHMQAFLDPQTPSQVYWIALPQMHVNAGGWVTKDQISKTERQILSLHTNRLYKAF